MNEQIVKDIEEQLARQRAKWGEQNHLPYTWIAILGEEYGEVCHAALERDDSNYREELIHVLSVAVSQLECWDKNKTFNAHSGEG